MLINCRGNLIDLNTPKVMGILNVTPDSFYDGGKYTHEDTILKKVNQMLKEGATFIDIGGASSKPSAAIISKEEETERVIPIIKLLIKHFPNILISIDTYHSEIAQEAVEAGACMINDISAGNLDSKMFDTVTSLQVPYVMMHMQGTPQTMQQNPNYKDIVTEINSFFSKKIALLREKGLNDIILDTGFGFGKTIEHNYQLLKNQDLIGFKEFPTLAGISRKSMIYKTLKKSPQEALNGTTVLNTIAFQKGASILRVHDVKEAMEAITLTQKLNLVEQ